MKDIEILKVIQSPIENIERIICSKKSSPNEKYIMKKTIFKSE